MTRQNYYKHLCKIGFSDLIAATMAAQSDDFARQMVTSNMRSEVYAFARWDLTLEGSDFWSGFISFLP